MDSIIDGVVVSQGGLGYTIDGQMGVWSGVMPPSRKRGDIIKFTRKSQQRLRRTLAVARPIGDGWCPFGVCLTIPGPVLPVERVRYLWHDWVMYYRLHHPDMPCIWRIELQTRGQAHWHLLVWSQTREDRPAAADVVWMGLEWRRLVRRIVGPLDGRTDRGFDRHGVDIRPLVGASATGMVGYLCDHESKRKQAQLGWRGRQWGVLNRRLLRWDTSPIVVVTPRQHVLAVRQYRRLQQRLRRDGVYTGVRITPSGNVSGSVFGRDANRLLACYDPRIIDSAAEAAQHRKEAPRGWAPIADHTERASAADASEGR